MTSAHDFVMKTLSGEDKKLSDYAGKAVLFVNVASKCGFTNQYTGLEALHRELTSKGLVIAGVPCNQFGSQEPGTASEIQTFCSTSYDVTFDLFAKVDVNGADAHPLYQWLTHEGPDAGAVKWNFAKFLVDKNGALVARFGSSTTPDSAALRAAIAATLA